MLCAMTTLLPRRRTTTRPTKRHAAEAEKLVRAARVSRRYLDASRPGMRATKRAGLDQSDYTVLQQSMAKVARMSEAEREHYRRVLPPKPAGRMHEALQLRIAGVPYWQIAEDLGEEEDTVRHWVLRQLEAYAGEEVRNADVARQLHLERLDAIMRGSWQKAAQGSADHATIVLRCMERASKLLGLDAPQKVDITHRLKLMAEQEGLDYEELLAEAQDIIKRLPPR